MNDCPASQDCPLPCWISIVGSRVDSHKLDVAGKPVARGNNLRRRFAFVVKTPAPFGARVFHFPRLRFTAPGTSAQTQGFAKDNTLISHEFNVRRSRILLTDHKIRRFLIGTERCGLTCKLTKSPLLGVTPCFFGSIHILRW